MPQTPTLGYFDKTLFNVYTFTGDVSVIEAQLSPGQSYNIQTIEEIVYIAVDISIELTDVDLTQI